MTHELTDYEKQRKADRENACMMHPDCRRLFDERVAELRLEPNAAVSLVESVFRKLLPKMSFATLNFTKEEYFNLIDKSFSELHTGIIKCAINIIKNSPFNSYANMDYEAKNVISACFDIEAQLDTAVIPIREKCIADFIENATFEQKSAVDKTIEQIRSQRNKGYAGKGQAMTSGKPTFIK